jgi:CRP/FNR family transcriptional regulator, cyclic AMP receptor protein
MRLRKDAKVDLISRVPLFARCSKKELRMIANLADVIEQPEGKTLIKEGRLGGEFFILIDGTARVSRGGRKLRDLAVGDWVGEIALIANVPRTATVVTTSPIRALVLVPRGFSQLIEDVPSIAAKLLAALGERIAPETI